jgi:hypothetical protein
MHMKEAIPLRCEFDAAKGWDDIIAWAFARRARLTLVSAFSRSYFFSPPARRSGVVGQRPWQGAANLASPAASRLAMSITATTTCPVPRP